MNGSKITKQLKLKINTLYRVVYKMSVCFDNSLNEVGSKHVSRLRRTITINCTEVQHDVKKTRHVLARERVRDTSNETKTTESVGSNDRDDTEMCEYVRRTV